MTENVRKLLRQMKTDDALIPVGMHQICSSTRRGMKQTLQRPYMESYGEWLASGVYQYIEAENMKNPSPHFVVEWNLESWNRLEKNLTIKSFKSCGLDLKTDGSKDNLIHFFREGQPCANGLDMLKEQQNLLSNVAYLNSNDTEEANTNNNLRDPSKSEDDLIDIEL